MSQIMRNGVSRLEARQASINLAAAAAVVTRPDPQCAVCGEIFNATRRDAQTCGGTCRQRLARRRRGREKRMMQAPEAAELQRQIATDLALLAQRVHDVANVQPGASKARRAWKQRYQLLEYLVRNTPAEGALVELRPGV